MENIVTIDTILDWFKKSVEEKIPLRPVDWLDSSAKLIVLSEDLDQEIVDLECDIADNMADYVRDESSVARAKVLAYSGKTFRELKKLLKKKERINQHIMIAKKRTEINEF